MLEQSLILAEISCKLTLDAKEWASLIYCEMTIETAVIARVISLSGMLFPMFGDVISILMPFDSNSEIFAENKDPMEGVYSAR